MKTDETAVAKLDPKDFGLELKQTESIEQAFEPKIAERKAIQAIYEKLITEDLTPEVSAQARELRLKLVTVGSGIKAVHKAEKEFSLATGRFIDAWKNKELLPVEQMKEKLQEIENHAVRMEEDRVNKLETERKEQLKPFEVSTEFLDLKSMSDEQFKNLLSDSEITFNAKAKAKQEEEERLAKVETDRLAAEAKAKKEQEEAARKEREEHKTIADRRELYYNSGFTYLKGEHLFVYGGVTIPFDLGQWLAMSADEFNSKLEKDKKLLNAEIKKEEQAEKDRLTKEKADQKAKQEAEEKERLASEKKNKTDLDRREKMFGMGLKWDGASFIFKDINFHWTDILTMTDAEFNKAYKGAVKRKEQIDAEVKESEDKANKLQEERNKLAQIETDRIAEEKTLLLAPEKEQLVAFLKKFDNIKFPAVKSEDCQDVLNYFAEDMEAAVKKANAYIDRM